MKLCPVCGANDQEHPCQTPSGRHWSEIGGTGEPMPAQLVAAMTDPALRTPEQRALLG